MTIEEIDELIANFTTDHGVIYPQVVEALEEFKVLNTQYSDLHDEYWSLIELNAGEDI